MGAKFARPPEAAALPRDCAPDAASSTTRRLPTPISRFLFSVEIVWLGWRSRHFPGGAWASVGCLAPVPAPPPLLAPPPPSHFREAAPWGSDEIGGAQLA